MEVTRNPKSEAAIVKDPSATIFTRRHYSADRTLDHPDEIFCTAKADNL